MARLLTRPGRFGELVRKFQLSIIVPHIVDESGNFLARTLPEHNTNRVLPRRSRETEEAIHLNMTLSPLSPVRQLNQAWVGLVGDGILSLQRVCKRLGGFPPGFQRIKHHEIKHNPKNHKGKGERHRDRDR